MPRPSKSEEWPEHGPLNIPVKKEQTIYTCEIGPEGRPSTTDKKFAGMKCTVIMPEMDEKGVRTMDDRETSFFKQTVSGDIDVAICYDGVLIVDGEQVVNIFDVVRQINDKLLDAVDSLQGALITESKKNCE